MAKKGAITKDMGIGEVVSGHPETFDVFVKNGLHCVGCAAASFETIAQGAEAHGIDVKKLVDELNKSVKGKK